MSKIGRGYWICECSCENKNHISIEGRSLTGKRKNLNCGCEKRVIIKKERKKRSKVDIIDQRFGRGVVTKRIEGKLHQGCYVYELKCDCGNYYESIYTYLRLGHIKSCGCLMEEKIREFDIGERFGYGEILRKNKERLYGKISWTLHCDCGNDYIATSSDLFYKRIKSCGCYRKKTASIAGKKSAFLDKVSSSELLKEWDFLKNTISPDEITLGSKQKVWCICSKCNHSWKAQIGARSNLNSGCPQCNESHGEKDIRLLFNKYEINYKQEKTFEGCRDINPLEFDFYLPDYNLCVEYQGMQHYKKIEYWDNETSLEDRKKRDQIKRDFCKSENIRLLEIPYWEIKNIEKILISELNIRPTPPE